jgi:hypothetical protein
LEVKTMRFSTERELQNYCLEVLKSKGIEAKQEVMTGGLRADIVTDSAVLELKKTLTRDAIFQALGQGSIYQKRLGKRELWIVGMSPRDSEQLRSAQHTANELAREGVKVSFVDVDSYWNKSRFNTQRWSVTEFVEKNKSTLLLAFIILCLMVWSAKNKESQPQQQTESKLSEVNTIISIRS